MFGYIVAPVKGLEEAELNRYKSAYCGLCRRIGERHGQIARLGLTYDMTFLTLLLASLYEPEEQSGRNRCLVHPKQPRDWAHSSMTDYAADMTIALVYHKSMDDWTDDRALHAKAYAGLLSSSYRKVKEQWPAQCACIEENMQEYTRLEKNQASGGELCTCFGKLMAGIMTPFNDEWTASLQTMGSYLGQFICMMDAAVDYDEDEKKHHYNLLRSMNISPEDARETLMILMGHVTAIFEKLPLVQDVTLLRSILYGGVWQQYNAAMKKRAGDTASPAQEGE